MNTSLLLYASLLVMSISAMDFQISEDEMIKCIDALLETDDINKNVDQNGNTLLMRVIIHGYQRAAEKILMSSKLIINKTNNDGMTALYKALVFERWVIVRIILQRNDDVTVNNADRFLDSTELHEAAAKKNLPKDIMELLLKRATDVNLKDRLGYTPLHEAAQSGSKNALFVLLQDKHCALESTDDFGRTPLCLAAERGHIDCVELLLKAGAKASKAIQELIKLADSLKNAPIDVDNNLLTSNLLAQLTTFMAGK